MQPDAAGNGNDIAVKTKSSSFLHVTRCKDSQEDSQLVPGSCETAVLPIRSSQNAFGTAYTLHEPDCAAIAGL